MKKGNSIKSKKDIKSKISRADQEKTRLRNSWSTHKQPLTKRSEIINLKTESSKETSISKVRESFPSNDLNSGISSFKMEDYLDKYNESQKLVEMFQEQKEDILENKKALEEKVNKLFLKMMNSMEQERSKVLRVLEDRFYCQKENVFALEKQLLLSGQKLEGFSQ